MERKTSPQTAKSLLGGRKGGRYDIAQPIRRRKIFKKAENPFYSGVIFPFTSGRPSKEFSGRCYKSNCIVPFTSGKDDNFFLSEGYFLPDFCPSI